MAKRLFWLASRLCKILTSVSRTVDIATGGQQDSDQDREAEIDLVHVTTIQCLRAALGPTMLELAGLFVHEIKKEGENTKFHKQSDCVNSLLRAVTKRDMKLGVLWSWARDRSPASMYCRGGGAWMMRLRCDGRSRRFNSRAWFAATLSDCMKRTAPLLVQRLLER